MPSQYMHGVKIIEQSGGIRPIRTIQTGVIGLVATADDADATAFPLNTPVLIAGDYNMLSKAGTTGTLLRSLKAIFDQIAPFIVVVRVPEANTEAAQNTAVIGGGLVEGGAFTGLHALLTAPSRCGITPRIIGAPGLDTLPVATEIATICDKLRGFGYVKAVGDDAADAIAYRAGFASKRLMLVWPSFTGWNSVTSSETALDATAYALGLRAKLDNDVGWHKTISNVGVNGVTGISKDVYFDLQSSSTTANWLNSHDITTLIRQDGYRFWGSRTCSDDPRFAFESATRTGDVLADTIAEAHQWALDLPMTRTLIKDILEGINAKFRELKSQGYIIDGAAWLDPAKNETTTLAAGELHIDYDYTPIPPLESLNFYQHITDSYLSQLTVN